ncbi:MAG: hypothetical protein PHI31_15025 [Desulfuromonadaceae bacterium]|nr:hypothetical protein [Desulfuromonadaceae bacterium]
MSECSLSGDCIFFNDKMAHRPATAELLKDKYCKGDHTSCVRMMIVNTKGRAHVPADLFPNQSVRVQDITKGS